MDSIKNQKCRFEGVKKVENLYAKDCIRTFTGKYVNVFDPDPDTICIEDIAHALSMQCRFGGHLWSFYSVAQHSIKCCIDVKTKKYKLSALMHDSSEAYLMDIARPIKEKLSNYKKIEKNLMTVISTKFNFQYPFPEEVIKIDNKLLQEEWDTLMLGKRDNIELFHKYIPRFTYTQAKKEFLRTFYLLKDGNL